MRGILFWWHMAVAMSKHVFGRWYVFRNTPEWVLEELTEVPQALIEEKAPGDYELWEFYKEARRELELRRRRNESA